MSFWSTIAYRKNCLFFLSMEKQHICINCSCIPLTYHKIQKKHNMLATLFFPSSCHALNLIIWFKASIIYCHVTVVLQRLLHAELNMLSNVQGIDVTHKNPVRPLSPCSLKRGSEELSQFPCCEFRMPASQITLEFPSVSKPVYSGLLLKKYRRVAPFFQIVAVTPCNAMTLTELECSRHPDISKGHLPLHEAVIRDPPLNILLFLRGRW